MNIKQSMLNKSNHMWLYSQQNAPLNFFQNYENTTNFLQKFLCEFMLNAMVNDIKQNKN